jgi:hypothetical protein
MTGVAFARSVPIARRQLGAKRGRTLAGIAGIGVALLLILALKAIFAGMETRLTAYIDSTGADVIVAQAGVETMHMTQSALPATAAAAVRGVVGVRTTEAILYKSAFVESRGDRSGIVAVVGGGPIPRLVAGRAPAAGEIVVDRALSDRLAVEVGDRVRVLGASSASRARSPGRRRSPARSPSSAARHSEASSTRTASPATCSSVPRRASSPRRSPGASTSGFRA